MQHINFIWIGRYNLLSYHYFGSMAIEKGILGLENAKYVTIFFKQCCQQANVHSWLTTQRGEFKDSHYLLLVSWLYQHQKLKFKTKSELARYILASDTLYKKIGFEAIRYHLKKRIKGRVFRMLRFVDARVMELLEVSDKT